MIWPAGTPNEIVIPALKLDPRLKGTPEEPAFDAVRDKQIVSLELSRAGYAFAVVTWNAIYLYQLKVCFNTNQLFVNR